MPSIQRHQDPFITLVISSCRSLANSTPNISVVIETVTGFGCYRSIRDNESGVTPIPIGYPIKDFDRVKSVQVAYETPSSILSSYKVDDKYSIIYADILRNSFKSLEFTVWSVVVIVLFIFAGLLVLRWLFNSLKEDTKEGNDLEDSPFFETFSQPTLESGQSSGSRGLPVKFSLVSFGLLQL